MITITPAVTAVRRACGLPLFLGGLALIGVIPLMFPASAAAQSAAKSFDLPAGSLESTLKRFSEQSGVEVLVPLEGVEGAQTQSVSGQMPPGRALGAMLMGSGFQAFRDVRTGAFTVRRTSEPGEQPVPLQAAAPPNPAPAVASSPPVAPRPSVAPVSADEKITLSPFMVTDTSDKGYYSDQSMIGTRHLEAVLDMDSSVSIITKEMMSDLNPTAVQQVLNYGASGVKQNQGFNDDFEIRGFRTLGAMRDGLVQAINETNELYDVERVEVLRGPAAMLYGDEGLLGGAVNLVTKRPTEEFHGQIQGETSNKNYLKGSLNVSGPLWDFEKAGVKVLYRVTLGGWKDDRFKSIQQRDEKFNGGALTFLFRDKTSITVNLSTYIDKTYMYFDDLSDPTYPNRGDVPDPYIPKFTWSLASPRNVFWHLKSKVFTTEFLHSFTENSSIRAVFGYFDKEDRRRHIRANGFVPGSIFMLNRTDLPIEIDSKLQTVQVDYLHNINIGPPHSWWGMSHAIEAGFQSLVTSGFQRLNTLTELPAIDIRNPDFSQDVLTQNYAFSSNSITYIDEVHYYAQDAVKLFDGRLTVLGGVRFIEHWNQALNALTNVYTYAHPPRRKVYKNGVVLKVTPSISIYGTVAANLVTGGGAILNPGTPYAYTSLDSEGTLKEVGVKFYGLQGHMYGTLAYFDMTQSNLNTAGPAPGGALGPDGKPLQINIPANQSSRGYDGELGFRQPFGKVGTADIVLTYLQLKSLTQNGTTFLNVSPYQYSALAKFRVDSGFLKSLTLGSGVHKQGAILELGGAVVNRLPVTAIAFASYDITKHLTARLNIDNLTDAWYIITGPGLAEGNDPRRFRLSMDYQW
jgi:iron complex outermembrane receptor protein